MRRLGGMAEGRAITTMHGLGYRCVELDEHAIIGKLPLAFWLDHIFVSPGVESTDFKRYDRRVPKGAKSV